MKVKIKICGLKTVDDILKINDFDIDYVGFVFAKSSRKVTKETAAYMKKALKRGIKTVGVFADMSLKEVKEIDDFVNLDVIQLHSDENDDFCGSFKEKTVWKSISVYNENPEISAVKFKNADGFVLDTYTKDMRGGSGKTFKWELAKNFSEKYFTILAGGLNEENVALAFETVKPHVLDLSSSVETNGVKDYNKIKNIVNQLENE